MTDQRYQALVRALPNAERAGDVRFARAPGRVNLIGEHTDYQEGYCLPVAIDRDVLVAVRLRHDRRITARSLDVDGIVDIDLTVPFEAARLEPSWATLLGGCILSLREQGIDARGADLAIASTVPLGSGLSSSAAFAVAACLVLSSLDATALRGTQLAAVAQRAEHLAGVPCGILDQMASVHGRSGHALLLDCRDLTVIPLPLPADLAIVIIDSGVARVLADSKYAERRAACAAAAARLGVGALRDVELRDVADDRFARHVVSENTRVLAFRDALRTDDRGALGALMDASHASLAGDFAVSTPELDLLTEMLRDEGALGARLTGAGFGGCVVALAPASDAAGIAARATARYRDATRRLAMGFVAHAANGAETVAQPPE